MEITQEAVRQIELVHSSWLRFEVAGEHHKLVSLCADDVQLRPPYELPLVGRHAVSGWLAQDVKRVHHIEISDLQVTGSSEIAYLTAGYRTTFSSPTNSRPQEVCGHHLWLLRHHDCLWLVILVSWSVSKSSFLRCDTHLSPGAV